MIKQRIHIALLLLLPTLCLGQVKESSRTSMPHDFQIWGEASINYLLSKKNCVGIEQGWRMGENASQLDVGYTELSYSRDLPKKMTLSGGYRLKYNQEGVQGMRFYGDYVYAPKIWGQKWNVRLRYQLEPEPENDEHKLRLKVGTRWPVSDWPLTFQIQGEVFKELAGNEILAWNKLRMTSGIKWKVNKRQKISVYYRQEFMPNQYRYILGVGYSLKIKSKKRKNEKN